MPRYLAKPTPEQNLAAHLASSGVSSLLDVKFARWLDTHDNLANMRCMYYIPTIESITREAPRRERQLTAEEVVAQNQRERAARQASRRRLSPGPVTESKQGAETGTEQTTAHENGGVANGTSSQADQPALSEEKGDAASGTDSEVEDGHTSASSNGSIERRSANKVRRDVLKEAHGPSILHTGNKAQEAPLSSDDQRNGSGRAITSSTSKAPISLRPENHESIVYLAGNSLGLQSQLSFQYVNEELAMWQTKAVTGWFNSHYERPWKSYAEDITAMMAGLVGASKTEVGIMGTLTANLHLLLCSFYRPTKDRYKIMFESKAFPSDNYAFASQVEMHGYDKKDALVRVGPRKGEYCLRIEDILEAIETQGDEVAVVFFSGVNYFTGQVFDMQRITEAAHKKGCLVGWDLAHGVGNIPLELHNWEADFAVWCTYKYLNSGPGGIGAFYVHEKHSERPRLAGWWGNSLKTRFNMAEDFDPAPGAAGFVTSTPSILGLASLLGSLESFMLCGKEESSQQEAPASTKTALQKLRKKSLLMTAYLNCLLKASKYYVPLDKVDDFEASVGESYKDPSAKQFKPGFTILTPEKADERGSQLSVLLLPRNIGMLKHTNKNLEDAGVYGDEREPDVIRFSPIPLYNTYKECFMTARTLDWALKMTAALIQGRPRKKVQLADQE